MLIQCPECGKEISDKAAACPYCGCPASVWQASAQTEEKTESMENCFSDSAEEKPLENAGCPGSPEPQGLEQQAREGTEKKHSRNRERALYAGVAVLFILIGVAFVRFTNNRNQALHEEIKPPATAAPKTEYQPVSTPARPSSSVSSASSSTADSVNTARHTNAEAFTVAQDIVEKNLKSPSTAEFCKVTDAEITHLGNGEYMVYGWVDAQNGYGAVLRTNFLVTYTAIKQGNDIGYKNGNVIFD